jgi:hypothetical protein
MSKLSELVKFKDELNSIVDKLTISSDINYRISMIESIVTPEDVSDIQDKTNSLINRYKQLDIDSQNIVNSLVELISTVDDQINDQANKLMQQEQKNESMLKKFQEYTDRSGYQISEKLRTLITTRSLWYYPGLQMYPISKDWIDLMVANDPLYLLDTDLNLLLDKIKEYPDQYQRRLCLYQDIDQLPYNQFGIVLIWGFLNYMPFDYTVDYLKKCLLLLRPGGTLMFTYNNCDIHPMARLAEGNSLYYSSESRLAKLCKEIGYEVIGSHDDVLIESVRISSWFELRKPGESATSKRSQAIGSILPK